MTAKSFTPPTTEFSADQFKSGAAATGGVDANSGNQIQPSAPTPTNTGKERVNPLGELEPSTVPNAVAPFDPTRKAAVQEPVDAAYAVDPAAPPASQKNEYAFTLDETVAARLKRFVELEGDAPLTAEALIDKLEAYKHRDEAMTNLLMERGVYESEKLTQLQALKTMDSRDLVKSQLKEQGYTDEEVVTQLEILDDAGTIDKQAELFRLRIGREEVAENDRLRSAYAADIQNKKLQVDGSKTLEVVNAAKKEFKERLNGKDSLLDVKLGKTPEEIEAKREELATKMANGEAMDAILVNPEAFMQAAFLALDFETVKSALKNKGVEIGKQAILQKIMHPDRPSQARSPLNVDSAEFDPTKFLAGSKQVARSSF